MKNAFLTNTVVAQPFGKKDWVYLFLIISHFNKKVSRCEYTLYYKKV